MSVFGIGVLGSGQDGGGVSSNLAQRSNSLTVWVNELRLRSRVGVAFGAEDAGNRIRGMWGKSLYGGPLYERLFAPPRRDAGPSGLKDPPRPYVLRTRELEGRRFEAGEEIPFRVHVFDRGWEQGEKVVLDLSGTAEGVRRVKVEFLTPTELKGAEGVEFGGLFARLRDRISTLRALYGEGPLEIDFRGMEERARRVRTIGSQVRWMERERVSRATGQRHGIGGFAGWAIYEGEMDEFLPYLEAGAWTGVGRQTVWGKGELRVARVDLD